MKLNRVLMAFVMVGAVSSSAFAGKMLNKKIQADMQESNKDGLESVNKDCGSQIKLQIPMEQYDQKVWGQNDDGASGTYPPCGIVMDGIRQVCAKSDDFKKAVASTLKILVCQPTSAEKFSVKMVGPKLVFKAAKPDADSNPSTDAVVKAIIAEIDK